MEQFENLLKTLELERDNRYSKLQELRIKAESLDLVIIKLRNAIIQAKREAQNETTD